MFTCSNFHFSTFETETCTMPKTSRGLFLKGQTDFALYNLISPSSSSFIDVHACLSLLCEHMLIHNNSKCVISCLPPLFERVFGCVSQLNVGAAGPYGTCGRQSVPAALQKQQKTNRSIFGEGAMEHSHRASLGTLATRRRRENEATKAGGGGGGLEQDV